MAISNLRFNRDDIKDELQKKGVVTREITPSPHFLTILESVGYKTSEAFCELPDNGIDAEATKIITYFGKENKKPYVVIGDNGFGMEPDTLFGALCLGASSLELGDKEKHSNGYLGKYGTGLKGALAALQGVAIILTKTKDGELFKTIYHKDSVQEYYDSINPETGKPRNAWGINLYITTDKEDLELFETYTDGSKHGTVIKIYDIERYTDSQYYKNRMRHVFSRTYQRFINNGIEFIVNDIVLSPVDLCGYEVPFSLNGESHSSKQMGTDHIWNNLIYTDKDGVKHKDGYLRYRAFLLPQQDVVDESAWKEEFDWNMTNQGIVVYRSNRMIQSNNWLGLEGTNPRLNRFRVELDFNGELDDLLKVDFKKTTIDPMGEILGLFSGQFKRDKNNASVVFNNASGKNNKISQSLNKLAKRFSTWAKNNASLLPKIPKIPSNIRTNKKRRTTTHTVTGKPMKQVGDRLRFIFDDQIYDGSFYKTETSGRYNNCLDIYWNKNHIMVMSFVENADPYSLSPLVCMIWAEHFGKEMNRPVTSAKKLNEFEELWTRMQIDKGSWLTKMYPTTPKV